MSCPYNWPDFEFTEDVLNLFTLHTSHMIPDGIDLDPDTFQNIITQVRDYFKLNLPGYIDCRIDAIGDKLSSGHYQSLVDAVVAKFTEEANQFDLSRLDGLITNFNTKLHDGDYNTIIDTLLDTVENRFNTKLTSGHYTGTITNILNSLMTNMNTLLDSSQFTTLLGSLRTKLLQEFNISSDIVIYLIIGIFMLIILPLIYTNSKFNEINESIKAISVTN